MTGGLLHRSVNRPLVLLDTILVGHFSFLLCVVSAIERRGVESECQHHCPSSSQSQSVGDFDQCSAVIELGQRGMDCTGLAFSVSLKIFWTSIASAVLWVLSSPGKKGKQNVPPSCSSCPFAVCRVELVQLSVQYSGPPSPSSSCLPSRMFWSALFNIVDVILFVFVTRLTSACPWCFAHPRRGWRGVEYCCSFEAWRGKSDVCMHFGNKPCNNPGLVADT